MTPCFACGSIAPYDSDHTALVHVLWEAQRSGLTISDADALASLIMRSEWMRAVRLHAAPQRETGVGAASQPVPLGEAVVER